ncbi:MAG: hypothetical protein N5P05_004341 (plasmid) [Chroococcopsis gigantea SAG 12.99]|nr:hypothetical protein [Chroococcopsis gigantea SAG 12.99]
MYCKKNFQAQIFDLEQNVLHQHCLLSFPTRIALSKYKQKRGNNMRLTSYGKQK